jgi:hypothetical protein
MCIEREVYGWKHMQSREERRCCFGITQKERG